MKSLGQLIADYTTQLQQGALQTAYKGIFDYLGRLRSELAAKYPDYEVGNSIYQGYMDMSYFSLNTKQLKEKGLKIAIVYIHTKGKFEIWLSARNREILKKYQTVFRGCQINGCFHDADNEDAVIEYTLAAEPDFDNQLKLSETICEGTEKFLSAVVGLVG